MGMPVFGGSRSGHTMTADEICNFKPANASEAAGMPQGNPNPHRFKVLRAERIGGAAIALVHYPDCKNFEGFKILVFEHVAMYEASVKQGVLDPHFTEGMRSPIARLEPTDRGWALARKVAEALPCTE